MWLVKGGGLDQLYESTGATFDAFAKRISPAKVQLYRQLGFDLVMGERRGVYFWDAFGGKQYLNCHSNGGVFNLGHRNPTVLKAVRNALESIDIGNHHLVSGLRARLGERLAATTRDLLPKVVLTASGSEAVDVALKAARGATGRRKIISMNAAYHGNTGLAMAGSASDYSGPFGPPDPDFVKVPFDDLEAIAAVIDDETAAVLLEPIPATLGMPLPSAGYLPAVADLCRQRGARLVLDEVQTGLGRTGRIWAFQHLDTTPDAVVTGKGLSGGIYPMGAALLTDEMFEPFGVDPFAHTSTFGGSEVGCVGSLAVLDAIEAEGFLDRVGDLADRFRRGFADLPFTVQGIGLMTGLEFGVEGSGLMAAAKLIENGVFVVWAANRSSAIQFLPPLVTSDEEADEIITVFRKVFA